MPETHPVLCLAVIHSVENWQWAYKAAGDEAGAIAGVEKGIVRMIDALKSEEILEKVGGRFKLCSLIQHRLRELVDGARPLVERNGRSDLEVVIDEIAQDKITVDFEVGSVAETLPPSVRQEMLAEHHAHAAELPDLNNSSPAS